MTEINVKFNVQIPSGISISEEIKIEVEAPHTFVFTLPPGGETLTVDLGTKTKMNLFVIQSNKYSEHGKIPEHGKIKVKFGDDQGETKAIESPLTRPILMMGADIIEAFKLPNKLVFTNTFLKEESKLDPTTNQPVTDPKTNKPVTVDTMVKNTAQITILIGYEEETTGTSPS